MDQIASRTHASPDADVDTSNIITTTTTADIPHQDDPPSTPDSQSVTMCVEVDDPDSKKSATEKHSDEVEIMSNKPCLIVLGTDSSSKTENDDSIYSVADSSNEKEMFDDSSIYKKRKAEEDNPELSSKVRLIAAENSLSSTDISSNDISLPKNDDQTVFTCEITPVKTPFMYNTRRNSKRRNSSDSTYENKQPPSRLSKRSVSAELNREKNSSKITDESTEIFSKDFSGVPNLRTEFSIDSQKSICTIEEEPLFKSLNESSNNATNDSQNIVLFINSSQNDGMDINDDENVVEISNQRLTSSESITNSKTDDHIDQDTTVSINIDSPMTNDIPNNLQLKNKPYLSIGYSSSTPENAPSTENPIFKPLKHLHMSDNDSDSTPPFKEYNKSSKLLIESKLDNNIIKSGNSSISPFSNGHSDSSHINNLSNLTPPSFDVQIHYDNNNEFLSLLIVKTDHDIGVDISREYQKVHKKIYGGYSADVSKTNSQSSVSSLCLLQLPSSNRQTSFLSTSSCTSSTRTTDDAFAIPLRPGPNVSYQNFSRVQGIHVLKQKMDEVISQLLDFYGNDNSTQSAMHTSDRNSISNPFEFNRKPNISNGKHESGENPEGTTPKSSKKKLQTKNRRTVARKSKKDNLPTTKEETHIEDEINSPEMVNTDTNKCQRPSTPLTSKKSQNSFFNNNNLIKSPTQGDQAESSSMVVSKISSPVSKTENNFCSEGTLVLAKWGDKKYYSGKVKQVLSPNKYIIRFDDGQTKTLLDDFIIFGTTKELPILGQSIYAIVEDDQTYEPSLVLSLVNNEDGTVLYKCTTDRDITVSVKASDIYVTEDQAKSIKENCSPKSPNSTPNTPRRRVNRELDLDNIIHGPRVPRFRDKCGSNKKDSNAKASTSGIPRKHRIFNETTVVQPKQRQESESSESGDFIIRAASTSLEEVSGVQPEVQKTPRKIEGVKVADALLIKGISKQNGGKRCSKVNKFESDKDTNNSLGPIPSKGSTLFKDLHFLLTCTDLPNPQPNRNKHNSSYSCSDSESQTTSTDKEDCLFTATPFHKERLKEQLESAGGTVYSHFEDIPKNIYSVCKLIAPRPCVTAKYIQCLGADIQALSHLWVVRSCLKNKLVNMNENALPAGWSIEKERFLNWQISSRDRMSSTPFKDSLLLLCSDNETFIKFWGRVCTLAGGETRTINEDDLNLRGGLVIVTESDCPHEVQNKAVQDNIPLVSTIWVTQCLIEGRICDHNANVKYNFTYNDTD